MLSRTCRCVRLSDHQRCCHKQPIAIAAGIITYAPYPVNAALGRRAPRMRARPVFSCGPGRDLSPLDSLVTRERGVGVPPEVFKVFHNLLGTGDMEVLESVVHHASGIAPGERHHVALSLLQNFYRLLE